MGIVRCLVVGLALLAIGEVRAQVPEEGIARKQLELGVFTLRRGAEHTVNVTVSPYSIHSAIMLLRVGARGETANQMDEKLLGGSFSPETQASYAKLNSEISRSDEAVTSTVANAVWLRSGWAFRKEYVEDSTRIFASEPRSVDFASPEMARATINEWVASKTNTLIPHLLPSGFLTPRSTCVLVNALYFKSAWLHSFGKMATRDREFWISPSSSVKVPMMSTSRDMGYFETEGWHGVHLPYQAFDFLFVVLVPNEKLSVGEVGRGISADLFLRSFKESEFTKVNLQLPRFKARFSVDLVQQLTAYGLESLRDGDFSGVSTRDGSIGPVGGVMHEAVVSVDEIGTEAAAATAIGMVGAGMPGPDLSKPKEVTVDRPFAFALIHRSSQAPLFLGVVGDPR
jgi:serpin B